MVQIKKASIEKFLGPLAEAHLDVKVSLFVVSPKDQRLAKLDLGKLSSKERAERLRQWAQESRFVAVIEMGDMVFAHAHAKYATQLQKLDDLSLDGKKVTVKALTDEEAEQLTAIGNAFEEHVLHKTEEEISKEKGLELVAGQTMPRQYHARNRLVSDQIHPTQFLIEQMVKRDLGKIIADCMRQYSEAQRELQKQQEADERRYDIKRQAVKKDVQRQEVVKDEVNAQQVKRTVVDADAQHYDRTRGIQE